MSVDAQASNITVRHGEFEGEVLYEARVKELPDLVDTARLTRRPTSSRWTPSAGTTQWSSERDRRTSSGVAERLHRSIERFIS